MTIEPEIRRTRPGDAAVLAWLRLVRVFQKVEQITSRGLRCSKLSLAHFDVIMHVGAAEGLTQQELADSLLVTKGNVCQVLSRMEEAGLILRRQQGRANRVFLTDRGRELFDRAGPAHEKRMAGSFTGRSTDELRQLLALLLRVDHALSHSAVVDGPELITPQ